MSLQRGGNKEWCDVERVSQSRVFDVGVSNEEVSNGKIFSGKHKAMFCCWVSKQRVSTRISERTAAGVFFKHHVFFFFFSHSVIWL